MCVYICAENTSKINASKESNNDFLEGQWMVESDVAYD